MDSFDISAIAIILKALKERLGRELYESEIQTFSIARSGMAYEMILDTLKDERKSQKEIERYINAVVEEYKTL